MTALAEAARLAAALGPLRLSRSTRGGTAGSHPRARAGEGTEFWQFRPVFAGEPAGRIDWRRSARGDQLWARERERADPGLLTLWLDPSDSMEFASAPGLPTKRQRGAVLLLALGLAALAAGERVAAAGQGAVSSGEALAAALDGTSPPTPPRRGELLVAASDFLTKSPARLVAGDGGGVLLYMLDPAERDFPLTGDCLVETAPRGVALRLAPAEAARADYLAAITQNADRARAAATRPGWSMASHATDEAASSALSHIAARVVRSGR